MRKTICKAMCVLFPRLTASNSSSVGGREIELFTSVFTPNVLEAIGPRRAGDLATVYADPAKAKTVLGWEAKKTVADMCRDSWNWQSKNPNGY